jgi:methyl-accepting chemotaxis protein
MDVKKFKLATMFSVMFAGAFIAISALFYYYGYTKQVDVQNATLKSQAKSILDFADVLLESRNEKFFSGESTEIPQVIQNEVFDKFTNISGGKVFFKEASKTPMVPKNLATDYEAQAIDEFSKNKDLKEIEKVITEAGQDYYTLSRPIVAEEKCKMCHPTWTPGDVIAVENVKIELKDFYDALKENIILTVLTGIINITIILMLTHFLFSKYVSKRINRLLEVIFRVEKGNFIIEDLIKDEQLDDGNSKNEIDKLFTHVKNMVDSLKPVIANVVEASKNMAFQSSYSYVKIDETNKYVDVQYKSLSDSKDYLDNVLADNQKISKSLNNLIENSNESNEVVQISKNDVQNSLKQGSEAANAMDETSKSIFSLKQFSDEVSKMTEVITDIADETNLISLNAAIEAARAGVHGRSFSVVAEKIRELAEVSRSNADEISDVLGKIDRQIDAVTKSAVNSKESVLSLVDNSHKINESFEKVEETFNLISTSLSAFHDDFVNESKMLKNVNENLNDVKNSSNLLALNAKSTQDVMEGISHKSAQLKSLADGFELVLNNRENKRTVITPPVSAKDQNGHKVYIFDISDGGVSFYYDDKNISNTIDERVKLSLDTPLDGKNTIDCTIVYVSNAEMNNMHFYGAKQE